MRIDQNIHFSLGTVAIHMRLDTTAPFTRWILTPENPEDIKSGRFEDVVWQWLFFGGEFDAPDAVKVLNNHASINLEDEGSFRENIFASLPEWDGDSLSGLIGASELAEFLQYLKHCAEMIGVAFKGFRRSDGRKIEFESFL